MPISASIASEYYKLQNMWKNIDPDRHWRIAIWLAKAEDMILIDKFPVVEQSASGVFDDIFFRFESRYEGDKEAYNRYL